MSNIMPGVMWTDANGNDRYTDLPTRLLKDRIIILEGEINPEMATGICYIWNLKIKKNLLKC